MMDRLSKWDKKGLIILTVIVLAFVAVCYLKYKLDQNEREFILKDYSSSTGQIVEYHDMSNSDGSGRSIKYSYLVGEKLFSRKMHTSHFIHGCEKLGEGCLKKRFWIVYSNDDPSLSLINLNEEIQDKRSPTPPQALDDFQ